MRLFVVLILALGITKGDDGFCSLDQDVPCNDDGNSGGDSVIADTVLDAAASLGDEDGNKTEKWEKVTYNKLSYTNDLDWEIRELLDEADENIALKPELAIQMFTDILAKHPSSPRAFYARTRSRQFLNTSEWSQEEKNKLHDQIHREFLEIIKRNEEEIPMTLYSSAVHQALIFGASLNDTDKTIQVLSTAISQRSAPVQKYNEILLHEYLRAGRYEEALQAADDALERFHWSKHIQFLKGVLLKKLNRKKEGNKLLRDIDADMSDTVNFGVDIQELCDDLIDRGKTEDVDLIFKEASKIHLFLSRYQRPLEAIPNIESKPIWNLKEDVSLTVHEEEMDLLKENFDSIRAEAVELAKNHSNWMERKDRYVKEGEWLDYVLFTWGNKRKFHCSQAPKTCSVMKKFSASATCERCLVKFNLLTPKTKIRSFVGPSNGRLRMHLPLVVGSGGKAWMRVGKDSIVHWEEGKPVVFDDSYEHEMANEDEESDRIVLVIDVPHPEVTDKRNRLNTYARNTYMLY